MRSLLVRPPFTREEWANAEVSDLARGPMGRRLADYLALYTEAVVKQGRERLDALLHEAGMPLQSEEPFSVPWLRRVLKRLSQRRAGFGVEFLEQLLAVNSFVDYVTGQAGVRLGKKTRHWADLCNDLAVLVLVVCVNEHFGFSPDAPG